ncbi:GNAT family N-acetyltransferase [Bacillaceae bacterium W0354]
MIRRGTTADLDQIVDVVNRAKKKMHQEGNFQWGDTYPNREHYAKDLNDGYLYVCEVEGKIVGAACISDVGHSEYEEINWSEEAAYFCMKRLVVDPQVQNQGIGRQFYQFIEDLAAEKGAKYVRADTNAINTAALKVFEKSGYQLVDQRKHDENEDVYNYYEKRVVKSES